MVYKVVWIGLGVLVTAGVVYLGVEGISVSKYALQMEIPIQKFIRK